MELSFSEILAVLFIALLVFGPEDLVRKSRKMGQWVGRIKNEMNNFRIMTEEALLNEDAKKEVKKLSEDLKNVIDVSSQDIQKSLNSKIQIENKAESAEAIESRIEALAKKNKGGGE